MKKLLYLFFCFVFCFIVQAADKSKFLRAVAEVESGNNPKAVGKFGELGAHQIHPRVFKQYKVNKSLKNSPKVATIHVDHLKAYFYSKTGRSPTVKELAAMWNMGEYGFAKTNFTLTRTSYAVRSYAERVNNIYESLRN